MRWSFRSSSTCSAMNHWMNSKPRWSPFATATPAARSNWPATVRSDSRRAACRAGGRVEARRGRLERRQVELDVVVDQEVDDLLGVFGFLDRLFAEELAPAVEALALEIDRDGQVERVGGQLVADLGDQELAQVGAQHRGSLDLVVIARAARGSDLRVAHDRIPAAVSTERSHRGLVQRFAKPPCGVTCIEGSNPSLSASLPASCARSSADRALGCGPKGRGFESRRARQLIVENPASSGPVGFREGRLGGLATNDSARHSTLPRTPEMRSDERP